jgi:hypothetical protein
MQKADLSLLQILGPREFYPSLAYLNPFRQISPLIPLIKTLRLYPARDRKNFTHFFIFKSLLKIKVQETEPHRLNLLLYNSKSVDILIVTTLFFFSFFCWRRSEKESLTAMQGILLL